MRSRTCYAVLLCAGAVLFGASVALSHELPPGDGKISTVDLPRQAPPPRQPPPL